MSKLLATLEKLEGFETQLVETDKKMRAARKDPTTTLATITALAKAGEQAANDFNDWMNTEFKFPDGPVIMPTILKTVLENTCEPKRIIAP